MRYGLGYEKEMSYSIIGKQLGGVTGTRASHIINKAIAKLRSKGLERCLDMVLDKNGNNLDA